MNISILGSTGSIGLQTLDVVRKLDKKSKITVAGLTANTNIDLLKKQIKEFKPVAVAVMDTKKALELKDQVDIEVYTGIDGICTIAQLGEADTVVNSLIGSIGITPTLKAIKSKKNIALANKETLVAAGDIVMKKARRAKVNIMPIDSEHSAIFQCINGEKKEDIKKIILTCSGGPFLRKRLRSLKDVTVEEALGHPTWEMGKKISIDSATLMNKGLEVIEAKWLYDLEPDQIEVVIHPESIVHSVVEFVDNSMLAQMNIPDMRLPIQYALNYPKRCKSIIKPLSFSKIKKLSFRNPDRKTFPCLKYAYDALEKGGTMPAVMNAANETAVEAFLKKRIDFLDIPNIIRQMMDAHTTFRNPPIERIINTDEKTKNDTENFIRGMR